MTTTQTRWYWIEVPVRYRDIDSFGHAHHSVALMFFEEARAAYWREVAGRPTLEDIDYVIGEVRVRYHVPMMYPDTVRVGVHLERIGTKSISLSYEIRSGDVLHVTGETTQVMFSRASGSTFDVDADLRARLSTY